MDNPVVEAVATALGDCGYAPLRFNWRGVGGSAGRVTGTIVDAIDDYLTALSEAQTIASKPASVGRCTRVLAAGYSFGAIAAAEVVARDDAAIERLVLVAPPVAMLESIDLGSFERPIHVVVGECDSFAPLKALTKILDRVPEARLDVIPDADHFFALPFWIGRLEELVRAPLL